MIKVGQKYCTTNSKAVGRITRIDRYDWVIIKWEKSKQGTLEKSLHSMKLFKQLIESGTMKICNDNDLKVGDPNQLFKRRVIK